MARKRIENAQSPPQIDRDRNRLHQQQSRARRREYISDLEARVRAAEARDAQATTAMQLAARHVVRENKLLRDLLCQHGQTSASISAYLASHGHGSVPVSQGHQGNTSGHREQKAQPRQETETMDGQELNDEMPCEEAAFIIAAMRGLDTPNDVYSELGCTTSQSCRVKNSTVLALAS